MAEAILKISSNWTGKNPKGLKISNNNVRGDGEANSLDISICNSLSLCSVISSIIELMAKRYNCSVSYKLDAVRSIVA